MSLPTAKIVELLVADGFREELIDIPFAQFSLPSEDYIARLGERFYSFLSSLGLTGPVEGAFMCRQYSLLALTHSAVEHAKTAQVDGMTTLLAMARCGVVRSDVGVHYNNLAIHLDRKGKPYIAYYEPQLSFSGKIGGFVSCLNNVTELVEGRLVCSFA